VGYWKVRVAVHNRLVELSLTELFGFLTGAIGVWLLARQNIWNWPIGIANGAFYVAVFLRSGLYGDAALQFVYIAMNAYGWVLWLRPREDHDLPVTRTPIPVWQWLLVFVLVAAVALRFFLGRFTDSTVPGFDGTTTALSLAAIYGQSKKYLESWWIWIVADLIYIPLYGYKGLWLTSILYGIFLILCVMGLRAWGHKLSR
jgi:nicotinamide mononucleotide transporter